MKAASLTTLVQREKVMMSFVMYINRFSKRGNRAHLFQSKLGLQSGLLQVMTQVRLESVVALNELSRSAQEPDISGGDEKLSLIHAF
ncbi:hypothetical protein CHE29_06355 [Salmonella enterica]|nr:hypothetical protein CHE29_06355 [Salmonella enterica]